MRIIRRNPEQNTAKNGLQPAQNGLTHRRNQFVSTFFPFGIAFDVLWRKYHRNHADNGIYAVATAIN